MMAPDQLSLLMDEHMTALILYARQWCRSPEDVVQEAFVKLTAAATVVASPAGWLYRVVRNGAISAARSDKVRRDRETEAASLAQNWFAANDPATRDLADLLAMLPLEQREAIVAHVWGRLTFAEIANLSGSSAATVHRRFVEGLAILKEKLADVHVPPADPGGN
jgi:RNA polymerase sigma-70 factor (ECF subfamily)